MGRLPLTQPEPTPNTRRFSPTQQVQLLTACTSRAFADTLAEHGYWPLRAESVQVLQVNVGKLCNQTCAHCHVDAGPDRTEVMDFAIAELCVQALAQAKIPTLDITGGAPELNPHFRWLVQSARALGCHVLDRCNLSVLLLPKYSELPDFLAEHQVEVVASLPCYLAENVDKQRGAGVFTKSVEALRRLNAVGYGQPGSGLTLTLVYNPVGASLPPPQANLEADYRRELSSRFGLVFSRLHTITNMPISRFLESLLAEGKHEQYQSKLVQAFNPATVAGVMCRTLLSVGWDGQLFDCDFNQMLELPVHVDQPGHIRDFLSGRLHERLITVGEHCFGCTAGAGSSCQGAVAVSTQR